MPPPREAARRWRATAVGPLLVIVVTIASLVPFADKAFHMDDPLFLWIARRILSDPGDFYGFAVNWYGTAEPIHAVAKNPPLAAYYIAAAARLAGWGERALHVAFLLPAVAVALGTYTVARRLCARPLVAALATTLTPAFLVSSTTVMSDTLLVAFWVWAVALWVHGIEGDRRPLLAASAVLVVLAALTKYYGASLIPLLSAYALLAGRRWGRWAPCLAVPVLVLVAYQWATSALYGRGLLLDALDYATTWAAPWRARSGAAVASSAVIGLAFIGGGLATVALYTFLSWSRRVFAGSALLTALLALAILSAAEVGGHPVVGAGGPRWGLVIQLALFAVAGLHVLALALADGWERRDAKSLLLLLWVAGTFLFASFLNWSINARSILPLAPAAGILVARRLDRTATSSPPGRAWRAMWPLVPGAAVALLVAAADYGLANSARTAAIAIHRAYGQSPGTLWFQGHWGFQYYMESGGAKPVDVKRYRLSPGDLLIIPASNTGTFPMPSAVALPRAIMEFSVPSFLATMSTVVGAAYYSDRWGGPLPFAFGAVPPERYFVLAVRAELRTN